MIFGSIKNNVTNKLFAYKSCIWHMYEQDQDGISMQFKCKYSSIVKNISISSYSV